MMQTYLNGKVTLEKLTPEATETGLFFGGDDRGMVAGVVRNEQFNFVEYVEFADRDVLRGNHTHNNYHERLFCISGSVTVTVWNAETTKSFKMNPGDLINIQPGITHKFVSKEQSQLLSMGFGADPFVDRVLE